MIEKRFIADSMLGKLAKWLRIAGFDVEYDNDIDDNVLVNRALSEDRIILTRDRNIEKRRAAKNCLLIRSDHLDEQLNQFLKIYNIATFEMAFSRCIRCNSLLSVVQKNVLADKVPSYVWKTNDNFKQCNSCKRIYWPGTHRENAEGFLRRFI